MADTAIIKARIQYAVNGDTTTLPLAIDYGNGRDFTWAAASASQVSRIVAAVSPGTTVDTASFATIEAVYILNESTGLGGQVKWDTVDLASATHHNAMYLTPGCPVILGTGVVPSVGINIIGDGDVIPCTVIVIGN